jgi:hypothetical protein
LAVYVLLVLQFFFRRFKKGPETIHL